jgi:isoleucyl-tRNA synthetase
MVELNKTINWKPASTGEGRFGNWLENLVDWNLSRSRFWGIPLPIWKTEGEEGEQICIGSVGELKMEIEKSVKAGFMDNNPLAKFEVGNMSKENYESFGLHRPYVDSIILCSSNAEPMKRELDLIDVWFDSGSMPYAQLHYPFENKEVFETSFPADFIAEGVDQTRGWFFTLHAISSILFEKVAFKNVVSNGLVLDKQGNKMSKRLGNTADPFETLSKYGADATRWYMISNAQPWDNLKFDLEGLDEVRRKFFGTLYNTYAFFALYANIDGFAYKEDDIALEERPEIDRWILSELNTLVEETNHCYEQYEPTKAARAIQLFVNNNLSNWYVRLCRRRFWKGEYQADKISAYQTLYNCLNTISIIGSPIAPFFMDQLFNDLNSVCNKYAVESVHLCDFPDVNMEMINKELEERMSLAHDLTSMVFSLRKKENLRVRQPLQKMMVPVLNSEFRANVDAISALVLAEVNVKELDFMDTDSGVLVKKIKPNFKTLGPKYGKDMKSISGAILQFQSSDIEKIENNGFVELQIGEQNLKIELSDLEISTEDIPGWAVTTLNGNTVALDISLNDDLRKEGLAREVINRIQNIRKDQGLEVTDRIKARLWAQDILESAVRDNLNYICAETLCDDIRIVNEIKEDKEVIELVDNITTQIEIIKS